MFFFNRENPIVTIELIDTNEPGSGSDIVDEEDEEEKESANVVTLTAWHEFIERHGANAVSGENDEISKSNDKIRRLKSC